MKVPFFRLKLGLAEKKAVMKVLKSGWVTSGPAVREFEEKTRQLVHAKYAIAVSSCTAGLHLALEAAGIGAGDEVITTPYTMAATVEAVLYTGATPVFADIDSSTLNIDPHEIENHISERTKAIIPVDIAGLPSDYSKLRSLARKFKLLVIEDAAHSFGAEYKGQPVGSLADATIFSFYSTKNITTGEGGMVVTDSGKFAERIRLLSLHGMTSSGWKRYAGGGWKYDIIDLGYKYNLSDLAAGLGLGQLVRFEQLRKRREMLAKRFLLNLKNMNEFIELPYQGPSSRHAWHLFIIKISSERLKIGRDRFIQEMEKRGVGCGVHFIPIYRFRHFKKSLGLFAANYPACDRAYHRVISLPFYPDLTIREVDYVCEVLSVVSRKFAR